MEYVGFWKRLLASLIDGIIFVPPFFALYWMAGDSRPLYCLATLLTQLCTLWFYVYLVKRYGGTPAKLILKIKIVSLSGENIDYQKAFLRTVIWFVPGLLLALHEIYIIMNMSDEYFVSMDFFDRFGIVEEGSVFLSTVYNMALMVWFVGGVVSILVNKEKRALHDFIAGTVVVKN